MPRKLKLLALHSFRTSAAIFQNQFQRARLDEKLCDLVDIVFINAPNPASGHIPRDVKRGGWGPPYYEWVTAEQAGDKLEYDSEQLDRSLALIEKTLKEQGPFDGLVGFSQGAIMASALAAMQAAGMIWDDVPRLKFCILFAGLKSRFSEHQPAFAVKIKVPSLHVFGDKDALRLHCAELAGAFEGAVVLTHARGHVVPALEGYQLAVMRAFLSAFLPPQPQLQLTQQQSAQQQQQQGKPATAAGDISADADGVEVGSSASSGGITGGASSGAGSGSEPPATLTGAALLLPDPKTNRGAVPTASRPNAVASPSKSWVHSNQRSKL